MHHYQVKLKLVGAAEVRYTRRELIGVPRTQCFVENLRQHAISHSQKCKNLGAFKLALAIKDVLVLLFEISYPVEGILLSKITLKQDANDSF